MNEATRLGQEPSPCGHLCLRSTVHGRGAREGAVGREDLTLHHRAPTPVHVAPALMIPPSLDGYCSGHAADREKQLWARARRSLALAPGLEAAPDEAPTPEGDAVELVRDRVRAGASVGRSKVKRLGSRRMPVRLMPS
jgi:hypothetical protein